MELGMLKGTFKSPATCYGREAEGRREREKVHTDLDDYALSLRYQWFRQKIY